MASSHVRHLCPTLFFVVALGLTPAWAAIGDDGQAPEQSVPREEGLQAAATEAGKAAAAEQTPPAPAPEAKSFPVSGGATFDLMSHYVWRGFLLTDAFAFQPTVWGKFGDLMVSSWSTWSTDQDGGPLMEHDLTVDYTKAVGKATLSAGWINYTFPPLDEGRYSNELYVGSAFATILNPTVKIYFDVHEGSGTYFNFGVSHPLPLGDKGILATPSAAIGYNHEQWIDDSAWHDANFGLKLTLPVHSRISLVPGIFYSVALNDFIEDKFYGGLSIATTF